MQPIQIIIELLSKRGISAAKMCKELGFSSGIFYQWKQGKQHPSLEKLSKMATYFGVTTDYLLGNEQKNKPAGLPDRHLTENQKLIIEKLTKLSPENLKLASAQLDMILNLQDKLKK